MENILALVENSGDESAVKEFQRIIDALGSALNIGEVKFKSNVFAAQVNEEIVAIIRDMQ